MNYQFYENYQKMFFIRLLYISFIHFLLIHIEDMNVKKRKIFYSSNSD